MRTRSGGGGVAQEQWRCLPHEAAQPSSAPRRWRSGVTAASRAAAVAGVPGPAAGAHLPQSSCGSSGGRFVSTHCLPWCMERRPAQVQSRIRMMYALQKVCRPTNLNRLSEPSRCYLPPCLVICRPVWLSAAVSGYMPPCLVICRPVWLSAALSGYLPPCPVICRPVWLSAALSGAAVPDILIVSLPMFLCRACVYVLFFRVVVVVIAAVLLQFLTSSSFPAGANVEWLENRLLQGESIEDSCH